MRKLIILLFFLLSFIGCTKVETVLQYPEIPPTGVYVRIKSFYPFDSLILKSGDIEVLYTKYEINGWKFNKLDSAFSDINVEFSWKDKIINLHPINSDLYKLDNGYYSIIISYGIDGAGNESFFSNWRVDNY